MVTNPAVDNTAIDDAAVTRLGEALYNARRTGVPIEPLTDAHPGLSVTDAYRIQRDLVSRLLSDGDRVSGYKLGLTSGPMQRMLGVDSPDFAPVLASHVHADGAEIGVAGFIHPRVEAEIALVLGADLAGPDCTALDVAAAVSGAAAAIEIVDSRIAGWRIKLADTIADLASSGAIVLGSAVVPLAGIDLRLAGMVFSRDGEVIATGAGAAALGSPLEATAWLVRTLAGLGESLRAGQFVMTGALHAAADIAAGQRYRADIDRLGPVSLRVKGDAR
ncbi:MAG TPA: fumarylacetoacetate hydrolase family protein [Streptosporangiaceae bacterium]